MVESQYEEIKSKIVSDATYIIPGARFQLLAEDVPREVNGLLNLLFCHRSLKEIFQIADPDDRDDRGCAKEQHRRNDEQDKQYEYGSGHAVSLLPRALLSGQEEIFVVSGATRQPSLKQQKQNSRIPRCSRL